MPVPASDADCGLLGVSSVMVTVAVRAPVAAGLKLMLIVQLAPGATEPAPVGQVLPAAKAKSAACAPVMVMRSEEHTSELQSQSNLVCRLLLEKKKQHTE